MRIGPSGSEVQDSACRHDSSVCQFFFILSYRGSKRTHPEMIVNGSWGCVVISAVPWTRFCCAVTNGKEVESQQVGALRGYEHANGVAMDLWEAVYPNVLLLALTDTFSTEGFYKVLSTVATPFLFARSICGWNGWADIFFFLLVFEKNVFRILSWIRHGRGDGKGCDKILEILTCLRHEQRRYTSL